MKKIYTWSIALMTILTSMVACSETDVEDTEYANWQARNQAHFATQLQRANDSIAVARQRYGSTWETQSNWRTYRNYKLASAPTATREDSIFVEIVKRGTGQTKALYSDSVHVRYRGLLMPTSTHPQGKVFSHSGLYEEEERVFDARYAGLSLFRVAGLVEGVTTATMQMVEGDRWRIYVPAKLAYGEKMAGTIPAHSCLIFDMEIVTLYNAEHTNATH